MKYFPDGRTLNKPLFCCQSTLDFAAARHIPSMIGRPAELLTC
jgi:hypothetical protein